MSGIKVKGRVIDSKVVFVSGGANPSLPILTTAVPIYKAREIGYSSFIIRGKAEKTVHKEFC